ncbi:hypothetical protein PR048_028798 [Dryococelus australis]|uniref:HTH psq-type domain-containing protein n=1 Tax=Dryococelus australis TaxID=614101 RepID=A0ABQ9GBK7_9NEOP|nr:hypothetical protein PR048_028798 [Dryococelus australis]
MVKHLDILKSYLSLSIALLGPSVFLVGETGPNITTDLLTSEVRTCNYCPTVIADFSGHVSQLLCPLIQRVIDLHRCPGRTRRCRMACEADTPALRSDCYGCEGTAANTARASWARTANIGPTFLPPSPHTSQKPTPGRDEGSRHSAARHFLISPCSLLLPTCHNNLSPFQQFNVVVPRRRRGNVPWSHGCTFTSNMFSSARSDIGSELVLIAVTKKAVRYSDEKLEACLTDMSTGKMSERKASVHYNIPRQTIRNKTKGLHSGKIGGQKVFFSNDGVEFVQHIECVANSGFPVTSARNALLSCNEVGKKGAPKNIQTDHGKEFYSPVFCVLMAAHNVNHYSILFPRVDLNRDCSTNSQVDQVHMAFSLLNQTKWFVFIHKPSDRAIDLCHAGLNVSGHTCNETDVRQPLSSSQLLLRIASQRAIRNTENENGSLRKVPEKKRLSRQVLTLLLCFGYHTNTTQQNRFPLWRIGRLLARQAPFDWKERIPKMNTYMIIQTKQFVIVHKVFRTVNRRKKAQSYEETLLSILKEKKKEEDIDEDKSFLLSLVPAFKRMTDDHKIEAKMSVLMKRVLVAGNTLANTYTKCAERRAIASICDCRLNSKVLYIRLTSAIERRLVWQVPRSLLANRKSSTGQPGKLITCLIASMCKTLNWRAVLTPATRLSRFSTENLSAYGFREKRVWSDARMRGPEEMGDPCENPPINGIVRSDSHVRKSGSDPAGNRTRFAMVWQASNLTTTPPRPQLLRRLYRITLQCNSQALSAVTMPFAASKLIAVTSRSRSLIFILPSSSCRILFYVSLFLLQSASMGKRTIQMGKSGPIKYENTFSSRQQPLAIDKLMMGTYSFEVYPCTDLRKEHTFQTRAVECFQDLTLIGNTISEHTEMAKNVFLHALYLKMYVSDPYKTSQGACIEPS